MSSMRDRLSNPKLADKRVGEYIPLTSSFYDYAQVTPKEALRWTANRDVHKQVSFDVCDIVSVVARDTTAFRIVTVLTEAGAPKLFALVQSGLV